MTHQLTPDEVAALSGITLTLPELLSRFGFRMRNFESVPVIAAALNDAGLVTDPPFTACERTTPIHIRRVADPTNPVCPEAVAEPDSDSDEESASATPPVRKFTVGELAVPLISVTPADDLALAQTRMRTNNFSQIPVIDGTSNLKGVVTWDSLARLRDKPHLAQTLAHAMDPKPPVADAYSDLFQRLSEICYHGYLLVRDSHGHLTGIVTAADVTERFHHMALPFFLVGEIEVLLRHCLRPLEPDGVKAVHGKKHSGDLHKLMFGGYIALIGHNHKNAELAAAADANWQTLNWKSIDRGDFLERLRTVKDIRNSIAHFDSKPPSEAEVTQLRQFKALLEHLA